MSIIGEWSRRVWYLLNRGRLDAELRREMEDHRSLMGDPRRFGNTARLHEDAREVWGWMWLDDLARDVRFAWRTLVRAPGFTLVAVTSLALATGAATAIFSVVHGVLLRPLPFGDPERLVQVYGTHPRSITSAINWRDLEAFQKQSTGFAAFTAYQPTIRHLQGPEGLERVTTVVAGLDFFSLLNVDARLGRVFRADDPRDVAVISARLWQRRFGGDSSVPGKSMTLDGRSFTVLGVMPDAFQFPYRAASLMAGALPESRTDLWIPHEPQPRGRASHVTARLKPGVSIGSASAELRVIAEHLEQLYPETNRGLGVRLEPLDESVVGPVRRSLWLLFAAVGLVLIAACANVANLLLARMTVRTREVVTRAALGAGRFRLRRQFLAESLLLSVAGGLAGVLIAKWGTNVLVTLGSARIPRAHEIDMDWYAFAFLLVVCLAATVLFGLAPAASAARMDVHSVTKEAAGHATTHRRHGRIRDALVVFEVALAFVLALGAALVMREAIRLQHVETGMQTRDTLTLHVTPRAPAHDYYAIEHRVAQLPGVQAAGFTQLVPLQNWGWEAGFSIRGRPREEPARTPIAGLRYVTPGYFRALGIPVVQGRAFTAADTEQALRVILVNAALARRYFPGEEAVGRELDRGTIVGVVGDVRQVGLDRPAEPEIYYPAAQNVTMASDIGMSLVVRTAGPPEPHTDAIRAAVRDVNPNLAIFNVKTMEQVLADSLWELNLYRWLIGLFAALALLLAAIGLYGVMSYNVTARMREFAVRLALGSDPGALSRLVLGRALRLAAAGLGGGVAIALALTPVISKLPVGTTLQPAAYALTGAVLFGIALVASVVPALRVGAVNPAAALRHD